MRRGRRRAATSLTGYLGFSLLVAGIITVAVLLYSFVSDASGGNSAVIAAVMLVCVLFLALVCTTVDLLRRRFTVERPTGRILDATDRIAAGDFSVRLDPSHTYGRYNAYDAIMENINRMAAELSKTEVLRTDFIANVSHEMKTPLSVIQNYAAAIGSEDISAETRREYADTIVSATKRLSALISDVLKLSKLENQEIFPDFRKVDLGEEFRSGVLQFEEAFERKNIEPECDIDDMTIVSDPGLLSVIWNNLLSNAVKFTPEGGRISVSLKNENGRAVIKVSDTGCGMTKETGAHIFDKFYQGDTSHAQEGNGLGLALVKKAVDIVGGEISVESEVGRGSTFTVALRAEP